MPYAVVNGLRLFYKDVGSGSPLVLIPGWGADSTVYNLVLAPLKARFRVIAADPRGLGRSDDGPPGPVTVRDLAGDLLGLLDRLGIAKASFLGTSMGALVARRLAALYPDRTDRLVLCSAGTGDMPYAGRIRRLLGALAEGSKPEEFMRHFLTLILSPKFIDQNEELLREIEIAYAPNARTLRTMKRHLEMIEADGGAADGAVRVPTLLIVGTLDRLVPLKHAEALQQSIPGSRLLVLDGVGHHPFMEAGREALDGLFAFFEETR